MFSVKIQIQRWSDIQANKTLNALKNAQILSCLDLLTFESFDEILSIQRIGTASIREIIVKMLELGHHEWVYETMRNTTASLRDNLQKLLS